METLIDNRTQSDDTPPNPYGRAGSRRGPGSVVNAIAIGVVSVIAIIAGSSTTAGAANTSASGSAPKTGTPRVLPAPIGYELATGNGITNGPVSPAAFDQWVGSGSAASFGYVAGDDVTYNNTVTNESLEITVFRFGSSADAAAFTKAAPAEDGASGLAPVNKALRAIPGSTVVVGTKAGSDGFYLVDAFARKGSTMMMIEYANTVNPHGIPQSLKSVATAQYRRL